MTQTANEGLCLLALSDCHPYHDITVEGSGILPIQSSDPLVHSDGFLTLGLVCPRDANAHGVFWYLSLAHSNLFWALLIKPKGQMERATLLLRIASCSNYDPNP